MIDFKSIFEVSSQCEYTCLSRVAAIRSGTLACCISPVGVLAFLGVPGYTASMKFAWDEQKNQSNMRKHGFSFADAWEIFAAPMLISLRKALSHERQTYEQAFGN
ncbi:BrnT family toxin [Candidatus Chloroploca mongolica]|nr:BrnT family toxin [Candidatus Chloroploca mongolica]